MTSATYFEPVQSYDFHIYYFHENKTSRTEAIQLKNKILKDFQSEIDNDSLILKVLRNESIKGPHITGFFEVDIESPAVFVKFFSWIQLNHGNLSVLVHPNSGDGFADHTAHSAWIGNKIPLITEFLVGDTSFPDFGFPNRDLITKEKFYTNPEHKGKSIMVRLLSNAGSVDSFWSEELFKSYEL
ncbi:hypothetical protein WICPIJ_006864 [Wickerhamomyces pijperi]|uniref:Dopa 4,5-dioxygenase n=1 Tax=Wickerhamomyces pijperi TaxID=599730 RepID=A0A9P8Q311_WICPI|nr:hypothetical protein WICPIJ_006864 [Wickerhamomyces pijperi]